MFVGAIGTKIQKVVTQKVEKLFFHAFTLTLFKDIFKTVSMWILSSLNKLDALTDQN